MVGLEPSLSRMPATAVIEPARRDHISTVHPRRSWRSVAIPAIVGALVATLMYVSFYPAAKIPSNDPQAQVA